MIEFVLDVLEGVLEYFSDRRERKRRKKAEQESLKASAEGDKDNSASPAK